MPRRHRRSTRSMRVLVGRETLENPGYVKHRKTALRMQDRHVAPRQNVRWNA